MKKWRAISFAMAMIMVVMSIQGSYLEVNASEMSKIQSDVEIEETFSGTSSEFEEVTDEAQKCADEWEKLRLLAEDKLECEYDDSISRIAISLDENKNIVFEADNAEETIVLTINEDDKEGMLYIHVAPQFMNTARR